MFQIRIAAHFIGRDCQYRRAFALVLRPAWISRDGCRTYTAKILNDLNFHNIMKNSIESMIKHNIQRKVHSVSA